MCIDGWVLPDILLDTEMKSQVDHSLHQEGAYWLVRMKAKWKQW